MFLGDPFNPPVSLSHFQEDNESILDQDLVCWITLGVNHVPTSEDVPVTTTGEFPVSRRCEGFVYYNRRVQVLEIAQID